MSSAYAYCHLVPPVVSLPPGSIEEIDLLPEDNLW
jgi:hypothetical protein